MTRRILAMAFLCTLGWLTVWGDGGGLHKVFTRPMPCGISGGSINDRGTAFCCGGTLGALVADADGSPQYILSNNHVLARTNNGSIGDDVIQPGLIDQSPTCFQDANDAVADLSAFVPINFKAKGSTPLNQVDAAIAEVRPNKVDSSGTILDIGQVAAGGGVAPTLDMAVAKSGRTTGFTQGKVTAVNVTVDIKYDGRRCGGGSGTARFVGQIVIQDGPGGTPAPFSAAGDSGSLIAQDGVSCRGAVGLLFAGSSSTTIGNPIGQVLGQFGKTMVGAPCTPSVAGSAAPGTSAAAVPQGASRRQIANIAVASDVKDRHSQALFNIAGVVGHGVGLSDTDPEDVVIEVYVEAAADQVRRQIPAALEGIPVRIVPTGQIVAF